PSATGAPRIRETSSRDTSSLQPRATPSPVPRPVLSGFRSRSHPPARWTVLHNRRSFRANFSSWPPRRPAQTAHLRSNPPPAHLQSNLSLHPALRFLPTDYLALCRGKDSSPHRFQFLGKVRPSRA